MIERKTISNIVSEDLVFARVLDFFGIKFYEYSSNTLSDLCERKGLSVAKILEQAEGYKQTNLRDQVRLEKYPVDLIVEYLKHAHQVFVKDRLSYIARLIEAYDISSPNADKRFMKDLQFIFPLFVEEFVHHIYEEEDCFFAYLNCLVEGTQLGGNVSKLYYALEANSVVDFSLKHGEDEDEMKGVRLITNDYKWFPHDDIHLQVIVKELKNFDEDLKSHALIEDTVLMPKAVRLEEKARKVVKERAVLN